MLDGDVAVLYQYTTKNINKQYPTLKIEYTNKFHDRFIIINNKRGSLNKTSHWVSKNNTNR